MALIYQTCLLLVCQDYSINVHHLCRLTVVISSQELVTWYNELVALTVQRHLAKLLGPLGVEVVPPAVIDPHMAHPDLDVTRAHGDMKV